MKNVIVQVVILNCVVLATTSVVLWLDATNGTEAQLTHNLHNAQYCGFNHCISVDETIHSIMFSVFSIFPSLFSDIFVHNLMEI